MNEQDKTMLPPTPSDEDRAGEESVHQVTFPDGSKPLHFNRRDFMRVAGATTAITALTVAGCQKPEEPILPFVERPEELRRLGKPLIYPTAVHDRPALVRTREGRPILIEPNPKHPMATSLTLQAQAALLDLYDPDRAKEPLFVNRGRTLPLPTSWDAIGKQVLSAVSQRKGAAVLLTRPLNGPGTRAILEDFSVTTGVEVVPYAPYSRKAEVDAWTACFGNAPMRFPSLSHAKLLVGLDADFLDTPQGEEPLRFVEARNPDQDMARFIAFEGRLSLTGSNADERVRVRPSALPRIAAALAHEIIVTHKIGPLAEDRQIVSWLSASKPDAVEFQAGLTAGRLVRIGEELARARENGLLVAGTSINHLPGGKALAVCVHLINYSLGALHRQNEQERFFEPPSHDPSALEQLMARMERGEIGLLLVHDANPVFDDPRGTAFAKAMQKVPLVVSFGDRVDETAAHADYLAPASHELESWGDVQYTTTMVGVRQPVIRPLYDTHGFLDILITWGAQAGTNLRLRAALAQSVNQGTTPAENSSAAYHYLRSHWQGRLLKPFGPDGLWALPVEQLWEDALRLGFHCIVPRPDVQKLSFFPEAVALVRELPEPIHEGVELQAFPHYALQDGRQGNNAWLLEFPDPISRVSWGDWLALSPKLFDRMKLTNGDLVRVQLKDKSSLTLPAFRQAGMHDYVAAFPLGFGRTKVGLVGDDVGRNGFSVLPVEDGAVRHGAIACVLKPTGEREPLAIAQGSEVIERKARPLVPVATLAAYKADPKAGTAQTLGGPSIWPNHDYKGLRWGMSIDLNRCVGCGQCVVACHTENNVPVVGKTGVTDGREMWWLRIDRYYDAPERKEGWQDNVWDGPPEVVEEPKTLFEPMLCQHCENAPCETVCPFVATMHSADGTNQMIYNRCVGTRYCANNCPFKVRRYNWFDYQEERTNPFFRLLVPQLKEHGLLNTRGRMQMKNNPEVTVRSRGVMEKCSFCVQRIKEARTAARLDGRKPDDLHDSEVHPACMDICPTKAIHFGNINDPSALVTQQANHPRAMRLLEATGVRPVISYLTKVRHET